MKQLLLLTYLIGFGLYPQNTVFDPLNSDGSLWEYAKFFNAGNNDWSIDEVLKDASFEYNALESENHSVGFTSDNYWVRFSLKNSTNETSTYYLETARPVTDIANLFQIGINGGTQHFKSGDKIPFSERQVKHRATVFKIELPANTTQEFYLHFKSDGETLNLPLNLYTASTFWMMNYSQQLFLGLFYGLLFLAGIIYLFFYTSLREKSFLYYGFYVFSIAFMQSALDGFIFEFIFPEGGFLNSRAVLITALFSNFFLLKYCEHFLKIELHLKAFKKVYNAIYVALAIVFLMLFINQKTLELAYPISNLNGLISLLLILVSLVTMRFRRIAIDRYFTVGIFFLVIGLLGFVMNNLSLLPNNFYTLNSAKFGSGLEVIFLSLSMTNLIKRLRLEKESSQVEALKKSEEISQLKTYFMSNMSHELRTPINAIMGIAQQELDAVQDNNEIRQQFETIKNASLSLLSNVNDIIDFEKIEKNELKLHLEDFNPSIVLNELCNNWQMEANKKGLDFNFEIDSNIPAKVHADSERFVQIINNVLANAVKFTKQGSVVFKLRCTQQPDDISRFSFKISDTGIGIDAESKQTIFDSFSQMRHNHQRAFGGIGLGLTIVKHLVGLFNGTIALESEPQKGTDIFIDLPLQDVSKSTDMPTEAQTENKAIPLHVLVVEDNKLNQMVMRKILGSFPHITFEVANNGQEALDFLEKDNYHLILMDLQMPVMDGYEATKIIRSGALGDNIKAIPIIAVTADALQETREHVMDLGMNDYTTKPVNKDVLLSKMNTLANTKKTDLKTA